MGSFSHLKLKGVRILSIQHPSHTASVLEVLISSPDIDLNSSGSLKSCSLDSSSFTNTVVSSAYCVIFISFVSTLTPLIDWSFLRALAKSSMSIINNRPDRGQPCLTPRCRRKKEEECPLFITQLEASLYKNQERSQYRGCSCVLYKTWCLEWVSRSHQYSDLSGIRFDRGL